jgi:hypothetical protein
MNGHKDAKGNFIPHSDSSKKLSSHQVDKPKQSSVNETDAQRLKRVKTPRNSMHVGEKDFLENSNNKWGNHITHSQEHQEKPDRRYLKSSYSTPEKRKQIEDDWTKDITRVTPTETIFDEDENGKTRTKHSDLVIGRPRLLDTGDSLGNGYDDEKRHLNFIKETGGHHHIYLGGK